MVTALSNIHQLIEELRYKRYSLFHERTDFNFIIPQFAQKRQGELEGHEVKLTWKQVCR